MIIILHKIFNRKTLKTSYSWTKNIFQIINYHNKEIISGKIQIMIYPDPEKLLNQRCELIDKCRHRNKFKL